MWSSLFCEGLVGSPIYRCSHRGYTRSRTLPSDYMIRGGVPRGTQGCPIPDSLSFSLWDPVPPLCWAASLNSFCVLVSPLEPSINAISTLQVPSGCRHSSSANGREPSSANSQSLWPLSRVWQCTWPPAQSCSLGREEVKLLQVNKKIWTVPALNTSFLAQKLWQVKVSKRAVLWPS